MNPWISQTRRFIAGVASVLLSISLSDANAQSSVPGPSFEQVISLRSAGGASISPDGRSVVFGVRTTEWQGNRFDNELWIARDGEQPFQLTRTDKGNSGTARWSPTENGSRFLADRGNKQQVFVIRHGWGSATDHRSQGGDRELPLGADGKRIAFTATGAEDKERKERTERFGEYAVDDAEYRMTNLWVVDVAPDLCRRRRGPCPRRAPEATRPSRAANRRPHRHRERAVCRATEARRLTEGTTYTVTVAMVARGRRSHLGINAIAHHVRIHGRHLCHRCYDEAGATARDDAGRDFFAVWSPDSRSILYSSAAGTDLDFYANSQLPYLTRRGRALVSRRTSTERRSLTWTRAGGCTASCGRGAASRRLVAHRSQHRPLAHHPGWARDSSASTSRPMDERPRSAARHRRRSVRCIARRDASTVQRGTAITDMTSGRDCDLHGTRS